MKEKTERKVGSPSVSEQLGVNQHRFSEGDDCDHTEHVDHENIHPTQLEAKAAQPMPLNRITNAAIRCVARRKYSKDQIRGKTLYKILKVLMGNRVAPFRVQNALDRLNLW